MLLKVRYLIFLGCFAASLISCTGLETKKIEELSNKLQNTSSWFNTSPQNVLTEGEKLVSVLNEISKLNVADVREIVARLIHKADTLDSANPGQALDIWSQVYVLNRYYFNIPAEEKITNVESFGGFQRPNDAQSLDVIWPLIFDSKGNLKLLGVFRGFSGDHYSGLEEFDYFNKKYGIRRASK